MLSIFTLFINARIKMGFPGGAVVKNPPTSAGDAGDLVVFYPWIKEIPWIRKWQCTPAFLSGNFHGWSGMGGYTFWSHRESDTTQQLSTEMELVSHENRRAKAFG